MMCRPLPLAILGLITLACQGTPAPITLVEPAPPGLTAEPRWFAFTCVTPNCDTTVTSRIRVEGERGIAIRRVIVSDPDRTDITVTPERNPPFIMEAGQSFTIDVRFTPNGDPRLQDLDIKVTYTDASSDESEDRVEPGELLLPVVRRLIGEPTMAVNPGELNFGPVLPQEERRLPITVHNEGFGNVGLLIEEVEIEPEGVVRIENMPPNGLTPGQSWDLQAVYAPTEEGILRGTLRIKSVGGAALPVTVPMLGTSIARPYLVTEPEQGVDLGEVPAGTDVQAVINLSNLGAKPLYMESVLLSGIPGDTQLTLDGQETLTGTIASLATRDFEMTIPLQNPGPINGFFRFVTTDPVNRVTDVPVVGLVTKPQIQVTPTEIDFGTVPRGWSVVRSVEVSNVGYGALVITNLSVLLGSSELFHLREVPNLPIVLRHDQRIGFEVEFQSGAEASFAGLISIDSNDAETPFVEINLGATGASCDLGCPIQNGSPSCSSGVCAVGSCNDGWFDTDGESANGCECAEVGNDPGSFCADSRYLGSLNDGDGDNTTFTGLLPSGEDQDVLRFFADDGSQLFGDDFDVRVSLQSADPSIRFCIFRHNTGNHLNECVFENEACPSNLSYRRDGSYGSDDSADFIVRVYRENSDAPTCTPYTLFVRNG